MILRRIAVERYGCFGTADFELRRGLNLLDGGNGSGKSLLLKVVPAVLLGTANGVRLRSWGETLSCRASLIFEDGGRQVRIQRDLENNLVRIDEQDGDGRWREIFSGTVVPTGSAAVRTHYNEQLQRLFGVGEEGLLGALLEPGSVRPLCDEDGRLAEVLPINPPAPSAPVVADRDPAARQAAIAALEAELATDRDEHCKGVEYLAWIRRKWQREAETRDAAKKPEKAGPAKASKNEAAQRTQQRDQLAGELQKLGISPHLPADLDEMFTDAEQIRQILAALQQELTPLQRTRQGATLPQIAWPLSISLAVAALPAAGYWLRAPWWMAAAAGGGLFLLVLWAVWVVRWRRARAIRGDLDEQIAQVETRRADALARQARLAEHFEAFGLPSSPVEMVKLQQACRRHADLIARYRDLCAACGDSEPATVAPAADGTAADRHLRPEELPEAEAKLAELAASLQRREVQLQALRAGAPLDEAAEESGRGPMPLLPAIARELDRLTGGCYRELRMMEGRLQVEAAPGRWTVPGACGRGFIETLALAIRLALVQTTGVGLPLAIDDLPASLDSRRRQSLLRVLERIAGERQLLLATSDDELVKRSAREHWAVIDLNRTPGSGAADVKEDEHAGQLHLL